MSEYVDASQTSEKKNHINKTMDGKPEDVIKDLFQNFQTEFPLTLQEDLYDIGILGAESDRFHIKKLKTLLEKFIKNSNGEPVTVVTIDHNAANTPRDVRLEEILKRATFYLLFVSKDFFESNWAQFAKSEAIEVKLAEDRECLIPVCPDGLQRPVSGLKGVKGINLVQLLKGKLFYDVDVDMLTCADLHVNIASSIEHVIQKQSYMKLKRLVEIREKRKIFTEKAKLRTIRDKSQPIPTDCQRQVQQGDDLVENKPKNQCDISPSVMKDGSKLRPVKTQRQDVRAASRLDIDVNDMALADDRSDSDGSIESFEMVEEEDRDISFDMADDEIDKN